MLGKYTTVKTYKNYDGKDSLSAHSLLQCKTKVASNEGSKRHVQITTEQINGKDTHQELLQIPPLDKEICLFLLHQVIIQHNSV